MTKNLSLVFLTLFFFNFSIAQTLRTVCSSGCDHPTIQAAVNASANGDFIQVADAVHTESGILIDKTLSICGKDPGNIVQAAATANSGGGRIFTINAETIVNINDLVMRHGSVGSNILGGAITSAGNLTLTNCRLSSNMANGGGAIAVTSNTSTLTLNQCLLDNNQVNDDGLNLAAGAALYLAGTATIINTTFSGNQNHTSGISTGGAITALSGAVLNLTHVTIAFNSIGSTGSGAGLAMLPGSSLNMINTIISNNSGPENLLNNGILVTNTTNIIPSCSSSTGGCGSFLTGDPALLALSDNGGCTSTHDLNGPSVAINAGTATAFTQDQRGQARSLPSPDIGAIELSAQVPACNASLLCQTINALPVELLYFAAEKSSRGILLNWATASEINNSGFEIYRSADGKDWGVMDFVPGNGNDVSGRSYRYMDAFPLIGKNYYKLRQLDFDGQYEDFAIRSVDWPRPEEKVRLYPNPVGDFMVLEFAQELDRQLIIRDMMGQIIYTQALGTGRQLRLILDERQLPKGFYIVEILSAEDLQNIQTLRISAL